MENVRKNKIFLIQTLSADTRICLQYVQNHNIIIQRDYNNLNQPNITNENIIINLLDTVINRGEQTCLQFMKLLENEEFQENFPQLKELFHEREDHPAMTHAANRQEGADFVDERRDVLIQRISSVMEIADCLLCKKTITAEMYSNIRAAATPQDQMRSLFVCLNSGGRGVKEEIYQILKKKNPHLVDDLIR